MSYEWSYAPTNRAKCKGKCGEKIEKGAIRLATSAEVADYSIASYRCLKCVTDKQFHNMVSKVGSIESVTGWETLSAKDQAAVRKQAGIKPAAKGVAKAAASPARKAKAKPEPKPEPKAKPKAAGRAAKAKPALKRKAAPAAPPVAKQHEFLNKAKEYDLDAVKAMLEELPGLVNVQPAGRWSALHQFAEKGDEDAVRYLLEMGADRNATNKDGQTPAEVAQGSAKDALEEEEEEEEAEAEEEAEEAEAEAAEAAEAEAAPVEEEKKGTKRKAPEAPSPAPKAAPSPAASSSMVTPPAKKGKMERPVDSEVPSREKYSVVDDWSVLLNQTNVGANNNKFYRIQLLKDDSEKVFLWTRWGRVGVAGQSNLSLCGSQANAESQFKAKFKDKSGVHYDLRESHDWTPTKGKYTIVKTEEQEGGGGDSAPLGKLTEEQIEKGQEVLQRMEAALTKKNEKQLVDLSSEYYTLIPHDFGFKVPPAIKTREMLEAEEELLKFYLRMGFEQLDKEEEGLLPISGVMTLALPSTLEAACSGVCTASSLKSSMSNGKKHAEKQSGGPTVHIEAHLYGALMLYTSNAIYRQLNAALRSEDRNKIKKYKPYLRLLFEALNRLPQQKRTLWRGIGVDLFDQYTVGSTITWWGVSSCTSDMQVAKNFMKGCGTACSFLTVNTKSAVDISNITFYGNEKESLLAPGTQLKVLNSSRKGKVSEITLEEVGRLVD